MESIKPGRYRHFKGKEYEVLGVARHSETAFGLISIFSRIWRMCTATVLSAPIASSFQMLS